MSPLFGAVLPPHDRQPHTEGARTAGCPRCDAQEQVLAIYLRSAAAPVRKRRSLLRRLLGAVLP